MKAEMYYAFSINEYKYKRLHFTRSKTREAAEKRHAVNFRAGEMSVERDTWTEVLHGRAALEAWAAEHRYTIDWEERVLTYRGDGE